ncbi:MAG: TRAP transporter substrate-binding protein [Mailhella sp.]
MKLGKILLSMACVALLAAPAQALTGKGTPEDPFIMKFANYYPDAGPIGHGIHAATVDWIEKELGGRIKFERYWSGSLHSLADGFKALRSGLSEFAQAYPFNNTNAFKYTTADGLPWLYKTTAHAAAAAQEMYPKWYKKEFERQGLLIGMTPYFGYEVLITKKPIRKMEDLKGLKIMGHGIHMRNTLAALGATPVFITPPEIFIALQRGVIDGVCWSAGCTVPWKYDEVAKYCTVTGMAQCGIFFGLHKPSFNALPKDLQKDFYRVLQGAALHMNKLYTDLDVNGFEEMKAKGMEIIQLDNAELAKWKAAGQKVWEDYEQQLNKAGLQGEEFLKDLRSVADKYNAMSVQELIDYRNANLVHGMIDGF